MLSAARTYRAGNCRTSLCRQRRSRLKDISNQCKKTAPGTIRCTCPLYTASKKKSEFSIPCGSTQRISHRSRWTAEMCSFLRARMGSRDRLPYAWGPPNGIPYTSSPYSCSCPRAFPISPPPPRAENPVTPCTRLYLITSTNSTSSSIGFPTASLLLCPQILTRVGRGSLKPHWCHVLTRDTLRQRPPALARDWARALVLYSAREACLGRIVRLPVGRILPRDLRQVRDPVATWYQLRSHHHDTLHISFPRFDPHHSMTYPKPNHRSGGISVLAGST